MGQTMATSISVTDMPIFDDNTSTADLDHLHI
jgi:hypothetical protein